MLGWSLICPLSTWQVRAGDRAVLLRLHLPPAQPQLPPAGAGRPPHLEEGGHLRGLVRGQGAQEVLLQGDTCHVSSVTCHAVLVQVCCQERLCGGCGRAECECRGGVVRGGYDGLVVLACVTRDTAPRPGRLDHEEVALVLECSLTTHFMQCGDPGLARTIVHTGRDSFLQVRPLLSSSPGCQPRVCRSTAPSWASPRSTPPTVSTWPTDSPRGAQSPPAAPTSPQPPPLSPAPAARRRRPRTTWRSRRSWRTSS